ncbi:AlpA family transcriptional regulator [Synechococcus sp. MU1642]|uniref:helix-turn-helix transcriptional regulator n=1 Tax=Synechococcus sp. MU1642 TaxID=2508348 RepID=UPI001CF820C7|nr:AlpA family transcriptional regulator [Synechococcus sp. MU1642]
MDLLFNTLIYGEIHLFPHFYQTMEIHSKAPRFLRLPEVLNLVGVTRSTLYRWMDAGTFPKQISVGGNTVVWVESAVTDWMEDQMASR